MRDIHTIFFSDNLKMNKIKAIVDEVAKTDVTVLINGETGTGKELVAEAIHFKSPRREKPLIRVNCAAIPKELLESELFGFEKGAFTGAHLMKPGKFELANGGTILLNHISEIDISIQAKLLQVLQEGAFSRLGGDGDVVVDTRVITTTKDLLERSLAEGRFREDLFFRINVISITVPPLRERSDQIVPLFKYFFDFYRKKYGKTSFSVSSKTIDAFREYHWPGNIRELENMIKRIVIVEEEESVFKELVRKNPEDKIEPGPETHLKASNRLPLKEAGRKAAAVAEIEVIQNALEETHWNRSEAARLLGVSYKGLLYKIQKYGLDGHK
jgi:transcriptional regulator with PAS, ATPase and Fis domain